MNTTSPNNRALRGRPTAKAISLIGLIAFAPVAGAQTIDYGSATNFGVLAGAGITIAASGPTIIHGDIGSSPTPTITGLANATIYGTNHGGDSSTVAAESSLQIAYSMADLRPPTTTYSAAQDLGGLLLAPGVYSSDVSFGITGTLTLDAGGDPNAYWIFQSNSTLTTASDSQIILIGGAQSSNVTWQVGSSATLGTNSAFEGTILAMTSITATDGAAINGRLLAINGSVTMDHNVLSVPEPGSLLLLGAGGVSACLIRRRRGCA